MSDNNIPFDIQVEILKKLPVKPLIKFRSVSKQYKSLIDSPGFISGYGVRDSHPHRLLVRYTDNDDYYYYNDLEKYVSFVDNDDGIFTQQEFAPTVPNVFTRLFNHFRIVGSSQGLFCFYGYYHFGTRIIKDDMLILWNPSIRKSVGITSPGELGWPNAPTEFVFGVCPVTSDPVVVKCIYVNTWEFEIFTMSSGIWKRVPFTTLPALESVNLIGSQVATDRFLYWGAFYEKVTLREPSSRIVSFDLTTKEFGILDLPDNLKRQSSFSLTISKLKESLAVIEDNRDMRNPGFVVWILMEQGVAKLFTKLFTINTPVSIVLGFKKNGDPIIVAQDHYDGPAALQVYERCSQHVISLGVCGQCDSFFVGPYMETLLLLDQPDCFIY